MVPASASRPLGAGCGSRFAAKVSLSKDRLHEFIQAELSYFAQRPPEVLRLGKIVRASTPGKVARLVHCELPYFFAARVKQIESLEGWAAHPELVRIREIFSYSFRELRLASPPLEAQAVADLADFSEVIFSLRKRHTPVTALLGEAMRKMIHEDPVIAAPFQAWADAFLQSRISTEMLTSHYLAIIESPPDQEGRKVGVVDTKCNPSRICEEAAAQVLTTLASQGDGGAGITIDVQANNCTDSRSEIEFSYIPRYLFYIVQELLQNSARATIEADRASRAAGVVVPRPITVTVCADRQQVAIRISDRGGGVPFGSGEKIWSYHFSTSEQPYQVYVDGASPLSGWGMGLPLARLYARYLGGSLELMNMPRIGVDAYLFLKRISLADSSSADI